MKTTPCTHFAVYFPVQLLPWCCPSAGAGGGVVLINIRGVGTCQKIPGPPKYNRDARKRVSVLTLVHDSVCTFARDTFVHDTFARDTFVRDTFARDTFVRDTFMCGTVYALC